MQLTKKELAAYMDHTLLKPEATSADIDRVVQEAKEIGAASVCINPYWVGRVSKELAGTATATCTVIGFPLGASSANVKAAEAQDALANGADEIDMVINIGELRANNNDAVRKDIEEVAKVVHTKDKLLKVILETCLLTKEEIMRSSKLSKEAGADFVKTSTGFSTGGASAKDVALMRETVGPELGVKASGGIHSYAEALEMIEAGADRLGVSASLEILAGAPDA